MSTANYHVILQRHCKLSCNFAVQRYNIMIE